MPYEMPIAISIMVLTPIVFCIWYVRKIIRDERAHEQVVSIKKFGKVDIEMLT